MTSAVTSSFSRSYSVQQMKIQQMKRDVKEKRRRRGGNSAEELLYISKCYLEIAIAKRCHLHKLIRQRFALALKDSAGRLCVDYFSR
ncbi:hypothetical protein F511_45026 [Dorcoceras hygrometricum]|uniref:Uncharacterized protein n=1 Tax=Dorcoceras hygrometricum TaxID=472368 RepID=A0A2Z6ZYA7_9LAMI|nr:hypothetical protein F511_45026 [Dorcoceras hygrometricum]